MTLTADGCRARRARLRSALVLGDPLHLRYFAGFHVDPINLAGDYAGLLELTADGRAVLYFDNKLKKEADAAHVDERRPLPWYDGDTAGHGPRRLALAQAGFSRVDDDWTNPTVVQAIATLRRQKDADEIELIERCIRAGEAGHAWARANLRAGMTELDAYNGVSAACVAAAGQPAIVYGDFAVSPGPERRGGPPTARVLADGDLFILDFSVVIGGYRGDFTNTLCIGKQPTPAQRRLLDLCLQAMHAGEALLKAGHTCQSVDDAVNGAFVQAGEAEHFGHHAGHGIGLAHPEAPFFVRHSSETLLAGDVVTLEPGLYIAGVGGLRIEHNYLITAAGYERLTHHELTLT